MSLSQSLIIPEHDYDIFAPSWQARLSCSQGLAKSLKNYDIESVNVVKTCEKLCLALSENQNSNDEPSQEGTEDADKQCAVRKANIPFRAVTNIWFGTLKIYQQQVDKLFRLSQDLLSRSCNYDVKHFEATKRKSSLKSHKLIKKRRLTLTESTDNTFFSTNYSDLLDDLERLTQENMHKSVEEKPSQPVSRSITQFQIREITIREISATTHSIAEVVDEDSGFGEATHEEIAEFLNFYEDNACTKVKKTPTKRKLSCEQRSVIKQGRYIQDSSIELECNENTTISENTLKKSITANNYSNTFAENTFMPHIGAPANGIVECDRIKLEDKPVVETKQISKVYGMKKKRIKLIIDECTKIETSEYIEEMKNAKLTTKLARNRILKRYRTGKCLTALELLTRFNRRSLKLSISLKQKTYLSQQQFEREYINLLREIFKMNYNQQLASEIFPKWKCFNEAQQKSNKSLRRNKLTNKIKSVVQPEESDSNNLPEYLNTDVVMDDNSIPVYNVIQDNNYNNQSMNSCGHHEWRPYGVMMNLLNLWRFNQTNEIAATALLKLAENRIDGALGFHSLLNLSKKHFVFLTKFPETIALQNIRMGKAVESNITTNFL